MPPALHPRSGFTTSLFTTTLALSFAVVGLPHVLPCPVDSKEYAEGQMEIIDKDGRRIRVRRLPKKRPENDTTPSNDSSATTQNTTQAEDDSPRRNRECPVPKPGGIIGQVLGFKNEGIPKPVVRIESSRIPRDTSAEGG